MSRPTLPIHQRKTEIIKFRVTKFELEKYRSAKDRLLNHSPTLAITDIFRKCLLLADDEALLQFLELDNNDPIKTKLRNDYLFNRLED